MFCDSFLTHDDRNQKVFLISALHENHEAKGWQMKTSTIQAGKLKMQILRIVYMQSDIKNAVIIS